MRDMPGSGSDLPILPHISSGGAELQGEFHNPSRKGASRYDIPIRGGKGVMEERTY